LEADGEVVEFLAPVAAMADRSRGRPDRVAPLAPMARRGRMRLGALLPRLARRRADGTGPGAAAGRPTRLREVYRSIAARYDPGPYGGLVTVVWPSEDPVAPSAASDAWRELAARVDLRVVPGTHITCLTDHVRSAAELLGHCLS